MRSGDPQHVSLTLSSEMQVQRDSLRVDAEDGRNQEHVQQPGDGERQRGEQMQKDQKKEKH